MFLFELEADPLTVKLVAVTNQLKSNIDSGSSSADWTVDELLEYLQLFGISIEKEDLFDMIKNPPMNKVISNIQGDKVIFSGQSGADTGDTDVDQDKKIVSQMAKSALK